MFRGVTYELFQHLMALQTRRGRRWGDNSALLGKMKEFQTKADCAKDKQ
jgi:hypothetical protein